mmetsp:Transcript_44746/g.85556  ORF Transcript_44746/g.85556 Transcript_44746/m.85556 type:complete len:211 (+) Transcript_44746:1101-1733(+)
MNPSIKMNNHPHANIRNSKSIPHRLYVCNIELNVLVQLDGRLHATLLNVRHEMRPLVRHVHLATAQASIVGFQPTPARIKPHLDEAEGLGRVEVVLRVRDSGARRHELHRPRPQRLLCAHGVLVRQLTLDDVCHNLGVAVAVLTKSPLRLHQVVVHHAHRPEPRPFGIVILGKGEMKTALQPILVRPRGVVHSVWGVTKHVRTGLAHKKS